MRQLVAIEGGLSLFLLEDEGILFSEGQQELYVLNTPATYVWCCLEEGMTPHQISAAFSSSFDVPLDQAAQTTGDLLSRWQASGYIRGVPDTAHSEIDWTTALARLMASPSLREEFKSRPRAVARKLRVASSDRKAFVSLVPAALESEALQLQKAKSAKPLENFFKSGQFVLWSSRAGKSRQSILQSALDARARRAGPDEARAVLPASDDDLCHSLLFRSRRSSGASGSRSLGGGTGPRSDAVLEVLNTKGGHVLLDGIAPFSFCRRSGTVGAAFENLAAPNGGAAPFLLSPDPCRCRIQRRKVYLASSRSRQWQNYLDRRPWLQRASTTSPTKLPCSKSRTSR